MEHLPELIKFEAYIECHEKITEVVDRFLEIIKDELKKGTPPMILLGSLLDCYGTFLVVLAEEFGKKHGLDKEMVRKIAMRYMTTDFMLRLSALELALGGGEHGDEGEG